jgi:hypothetical protein
MAESSPALARILESGRDDFNARFNHTRRYLPKLDAGKFIEHLRDTVTPIVEAVDQKFPDQTSAVVGKLYYLSLELVGREMLGPASRYPAIRDGWQRLLAVLPHLVAKDPEGMARAVTNALYNLSLQTGALPGNWIDTMLWLGPNCPDTAWFLECGKVTAWRCGMAHYRQTALEASRKLDQDWARAALGLHPSDRKTPIGEIIDRLQQDPWLNPAQLEGEARPRELKIVAAVGGFRGFGGVFLTPPDVVRVENQFVVFDTQGEWFLHADVFGTTFLRTDSRKTNAKPSSNTGDFQIDPKGRVTRGKERKDFPELAGSESWAADDSTLAVTIPLSHKVFLVAMA